MSVINTKEKINIPPSLIILKNSIIEGRIPTSDNLEIGELALGLFNGQESIWSKNSNGDIVNLRSPRHDLMWSDLFLKYDTLDEFKSDLNSGKVKDTSIVFIKNPSPQIWADGTYYTSSYSESDLEKIVSSKIISIPGKVYDLNNSSTSLEILDAFKSIDNFKTLVTNSIGTGILSAIKLPNGESIPVSVSPKIYSTTEYELKLEWIFEGQYVTELIILKGEVFTVTKHFLNFSNFIEIEENVGTLLDFNKPLVSPQIIGSWKFYNQKDEEIDIDGVNPNNPHLETGYKARFVGCYKWESKEGYKNPIKIEEGSCWTDLPGNGELSQEFTSDIVTTDSIISITLSSPKTGLMVNGDSVIPSEGFDYTSDKRTISFSGKMYYGIIEKESSDLTPYDIMSLNSSDIVSKNKVFENLSLSENEYFVYAYPHSFGELTQIMQDGSIPVLGAFNMREIKIINSAEATVTLYVYTTNNPGSFTGSTVEFK